MKYQLWGKAGHSLVTLHGMWLTPQFVAWWAVSCLGPLDQLLHQRSPGKGFFLQLCQASKEKLPAKYLLISSRRPMGLSQRDADRRHWLCLWGGYNLAVETDLIGKPSYFAHFPNGLSFTYSMLGAILRKGYWFYVEKYFYLKCFSF